MADIRIEIKNLPQIRAAFNASPRHMARNLRDGLIEIDRVIKPRSMADTPVDRGRLMRSHYSKFNPYSALGFYLEIGTKTPYDIFVHEGTRYMRPRRYLYNAVQEKQPTVDRILTRAVQKTLDEIGKSV